MSLLSSIQGVGLKSLKKVSDEPSSDTGRDDSSAPPPVSSNPLLASIAGGKSMLKPSDKKPPEKAGGSMMDAINAQKAKVSQLIYIYIMSFINDKYFIRWKTTGELLSLNRLHHKRIHEWLENPLVVSI
jgi:hypothetical protein